MAAFTLQTIAQALRAQIVCGAREDTVEITSASMARPGLALMGRFDGLDTALAQLYGPEELAFLFSVPKAEGERRVKNALAGGVPFTLAAGCDKAPHSLRDGALAQGVALLTTLDGSDEAQLRYTDFAGRALAQRASLHGVLMDIGGIGVLMRGEAGIGKSETALKLIRRGHRLVADDAVEVKVIGTHALIGAAPESIRHLMGIRGIGLIDIREIYGESAVRDSMPIHLSVQITSRRMDVYYERIGLEQVESDLFGVTLPEITVPVWPGRDLAEIVEVAVMSHSTGYKYMR